ncbi:MAG TPA: CBS domain-containing protein, partial [Polyangia bacterium]
TLVSATMSAPPETIDRTAPLSSACERMLAAHHSCLPVLDGARLCGIFTATDALRFASAALDDDDRVRRHAPEVAQLMTPRPLVVAKQTTTLVSAWQMMRANHVRHLPVLGDDGNVIGVLSDRDVLAAGREALREQTLQPPMVVADAMSTRLSTIEADRPATEAAAILLRRRVGALAVMRKSELRGIITVSDFMYWILARA